MFDAELVAYASQIVLIARTAKLKIVTAESCTGGLLAGLLTEISGSSDVFERGFVTYSNEAKSSLLGVAPAMIEDMGAVSFGVALAMANGALANSLAGVAVSVTGIAGPGGGSLLKPVGLVFIGCSVRSGTTNVQRYQFGDIGRSEVRRATLLAALSMLATAINQIDLRP